MRSAVFEVIYHGNPAILKLYHDPRPTYEIEAHLQFEQQNKSKLVFAPKLFDYQILTTHQGWLLMEKIPATCIQFARPASLLQRKELLDVYFEYLRNNPVRPNRTLNMIEHLSANEFHRFRLGRWFALANEEESKLIAKGKESVLSLMRFLPLYEMILKYLDRHFEQIKMNWYAHGLFQSQDIFYLPEKKIFYLTDFCRSGMYPEGYGLSSLIWSDWIVGVRTNISELEFSEGIDKWLDLIFDEYYFKAAQIWSLYQKSDARKTSANISKVRSLLKASLVERITGTILADITANAKMPIDEKRARVNCLQNYLASIVYKNTYI